MRIKDISEKVHLTIDGNNIPSMLFKLCKIDICDSLANSMNPSEVMGMADSIIEKIIQTIVNVWDEDPIFRDVIVCELIASSRLNILCDMKKYMN